MYGLLTDKIKIMVQFENYELGWIYDAIKAERKTIIELYKNLPKQQNEKEDCVSELDGILKKIKDERAHNANMNKAISSLIYKQD